MRPVILQICILHTDMYCTPRITSLTNDFIKAAYIAIPEGSPFELKIKHCHLVKRQVS